MSGLSFLRLKNIESDSGHASLTSETLLLLETLHPEKTWRDGTDFSGPDLSQVGEEKRIVWYSQIASVEMS